MMLLYPRLPSGTAKVLTREHSRLSLSELRALGTTRHEDADYAPVGGHRVEEAKLDLLQTHLRELAQDLGYPEHLGIRTGAFDQRFMTLLYSEMGIVPAEAAEEGVWSFLSLILVPELPVWRFPARHADRLRGHPRNTFRRLWWRAHTLGLEEDSPTSRLNEDQSVQIMERPSLAGSPEVARAVATAFLQVAEVDQDVPREALMREGAKYLIRLLPVVSLLHLPAEDLRRTARQCFLNAAAALQASGDR